MLKGLSSMNDCIGCSEYKNCEIMDMPDNDCPCKECVVKPICKIVYETECELLSKCKVLGSEKDEDG